MSHILTKKLADGLTITNVKTGNIVGCYWDDASKVTLQPVMTLPTASSANQKYYDWLNEYDFYEEAFVLELKAGVADVNDTKKPARLVVNTNAPTPTKGRWNITFQGTGFDEPVTIQDKKTSLYWTVSDQDAGHGNGEKLITLTPLNSNDQAQLFNIAY